MEAIIFDQMRSFSTIREAKAPSVEVHATTFEHCGQKECLDKRRFHPKKECWQLYPEKKKARYQNSKTGSSKNDSTSSTKATGKEKDRNHPRDDKNGNQRIIRNKGQIIMQELTKLLTNLVHQMTGHALSIMCEPIS